MENKIITRMKKRIQALAKGDIPACRVSISTSNLTRGLKEELYKFCDEHEASLNRATATVVQSETGEVD